MTVYVARDGAEIGEYPREELEQLARTGQLQPTDLCWFEGMENWLLLEDFLGTKAWNKSQLIAASQKPSRAVSPRRRMRVRPASIPERAVLPTVKLEPRAAVPMPPPSPWIFRVTLLFVVLIWLAAIAIKFVSPPNPAQPLSELIEKK